MHIGYCRSCPQPTNQKCWHAVISAKAVTNNNFLAKKLLFTIWYTLAVVRYRDGGANPLERLWIDFWDPKPRVCFLHLGVTRVFIRCLGEGMATRRCWMYGALSFSGMNGVGWSYDSWYDWVKQSKASKVVVKVMIAAIDVSLPEPHQQLCIAFLFLFFSLLTPKPRTHSSTQADELILHCKCQWGNRWAAALSTPPSTTHLTVNKGF